MAVGYSLASDPAGPIKKKKKVEDKDEEKELRMSYFRSEKNKAWTEYLKLKTALLKGES